LRELRYAIDFPSADAGSDLRSADEGFLPYTRVLSICQQRKLRCRTS
jgi:hypothetical protein